MGIAAIALFAFMGIAVDLAYTYSRKTELMNAADAASLSGAKELNENFLRQVFRLGHVTSHAQAE